MFISKPLITGKEMKKNVERKKRRSLTDVSGKKNTTKARYAGPAKGMPNLPWLASAGRVLIEPPFLPLYPGIQLRVCKGDLG
jgi:hypothetical protein